LLLLIGIGLALVPFLDATVGMPEATKRRVLRNMLTTTTTATAAALLLVPGGQLTRLLRFSPGALGVASGIILLIIAAAMVLGHQAGSSAGRRERWWL
jgi:small neutral amino acid transporter SnatA (MarC family)